MNRRAKLDVDVYCPEYRLSNMPRRDLIRVVYLKSNLDASIRLHVNNALIKQQHNRFKKIQPVDHLCCLDRGIVQRELQLSCVSNAVP